MSLIVGCRDCTGIDVVLGPLVSAKTFCFLLPEEDASGFEARGLRGFFGLSSFFGLPSASGSLRLRGFLTFSGLLGVVVFLAPIAPGI